MFTAIWEYFSTDFPKNSRLARALFYEMRPNLHKSTGRISAVVQLLRYRNCSRLPKEFTTQYCLRCKQFSKILYEKQQKQAVAS